MHLATVMAVFQRNVHALCIVLDISVLKKHMTDDTFYADVTLFTLCDQANEGNLCAIGTRQTMIAGSVIF
jgi:hypothetical protein